ncbi:uncharacterized protein LOC110844004 [Folsomia candida]|uniref:uncharacterized protein LOC110844004 n=1 Tax=Folsomia candida TaxID=158441 RepID=UPI000B8FD798|nr:uncharacterized protein LOC110844004 [Folsomia candida]
MLKKTGTVPFLLGPGLGLAIFPFLTVVIILNEIVRFLLAQLLRLVYGDKLELVSEGADGFWGYKKNGCSRNVVTYVVTPTGCLDRDKIVNFYRESIQNYRDEKDGTRPYKKFEKVMTTSFGYVCWKRAGRFNVNEHVRVLNEEKVFSSGDLQELLTEDFSKDMDETRPQWEIVLFPRYDDGSGEEKSILLCRFLHAYMDGLSFMMLFKEHITPDMEYTIDPLSFRIPLWKKALFYLNTFIYGPFFLTTMTLERFFIKPWVLRDTDRPRKKFYTWAKSRPISDGTIRKIRMHSNLKASVTNVLSVAFVTAAAKTLSPERLVDEMLISELVAYLPYKDSKPQNRFAYFTFPIPTVGGDDVYKKLRNCKRESFKSMVGPDVLGTYFFFKLAGRFPAFLSPLWLTHATSSVLLSNAPFSKRKVCFRDGTPILEMAGFTPQPNDMGLSVTTTRYGDEVKVFACADSTWLSQEELISLIDQIPIEIENMSRAIDTQNGTVSPNVEKDSNFRRSLQEGDDSEDEIENNEDNVHLDDNVEKRISISETETLPVFRSR